MKRITNERLILDYTVIINVHTIFFLFLQAENRSVSNLAENFITSIYINFIVNHA